MQESAFEDPPWLIEREGAGYVQVTELLYSIAEHADGHRTVQEIADAVSNVTGRTVSADNVRQLATTQLVAKGLMPTADGRVIGNAAGSRSLLAMSLRAKVIDPDALRPFTRVLQALFWPPVLGLIVVLSVLAIGWVFFVHGVAAGARELLYAPALMILALTVTALAAGFHELGHAAAISYGGGQPKGMGVGLYLVYPAFYTDVSDNYRLTRWGRVRTDLGGIIFHLVFVLGVIGAYALTHWEPLLIFVVLLLLDAFHQLMPLVRLDGYWTLADVTGVPDFYSYMGAFVRRFLPGKSDQPSRLPKLKWWGSLVFGLYMLIAVPLMLFAIFTMLRSAPTILATGWDSGRQQFGALEQAAGSGQILGSVAAFLQLLVLILPAVALVYSILRFARRIGTGVWNWSKPTPTRRVVGALGTAAACAGLVYLWAPSLPFSGGRSGPLYGPTSSSFMPIQPETRGTVFDAVGAQQPEWTFPAEIPSEKPSIAGSPEPAIGPAGTPAPTRGTAATPMTTPQATLEATVIATPDATAASVPTAAPTAPGAPVSAPAKPAAPTTPVPTPATVPTSVSAPTQVQSAPTQGPAPTSASAPTRVATPTAPTSGSSRAPATSPAPILPP